MKYVKILLLFSVALLVKCTDEVSPIVEGDNALTQQVEKITKNNKDPMIEIIRDSYKKLDNGEGVREQIQEEYGEINWEHGIGASRNGTSVYFFPLALKDGQKTEALLISTIEKESIDFKLQTREKLRNAIEKEREKDLGKRNWGNKPVKTMIMSGADIDLFGKTDPIFLEYLGEYEKSDAKEIKCVTIDICRFICTQWNYVQTAQGDRILEAVCVTTNLVCNRYRVCDPVDGSDPNGIGTNPYGGGSSGGSGGGGGGPAGGGSGSSGPLLYSSTIYPNLALHQFNRLVDEGYSADEIKGIDDLIQEIRTKITGLNFTWPSSQAEWVEFATILRDELLTIQTLTQFVPGVGDIVSALRNAANGNGLAAAFDIAMALTDFIPAKKVGHGSLAIANSVRKSYRILHRIINLRRIDVNFVNRMPTHWRRSMPNSGDGVKWVNPNNHFDNIRLKPGNPNSPHPNSRVPHVRRHKPGGYVDKHGNTVTNRFDPRGHIPWTDYTDFNFN